MPAKAGTATESAALTYAELLNHDEQETEQWHIWFRRHPEALDIKMELAMQHDVRGVLFHIFVIELLVVLKRVKLFARLAVPW